MNETDGADIVLKEVHPDSDLHLKSGDGEFLCEKYALSQFSLFSVVN